MQIIQVKDYTEMSHKAADIIAAQIAEKPDCVLGLATGSTPLGTYSCLIELYKNGNLDFSRVTSVNLDEYKGLSPENPQSYAFFMRENLFSHININPENTFLPNGLESDSQKAVSDYNELLHKIGSADLQILGLGLNGHIGFNEPGTDFVSETHCVDLTESTIHANQRFFESEKDVPRQAYTMGIKNIMQAKKILLLVNGNAKAEILHKALTGPVTPDVPASVLQQHPNVVVVADDEALALF